MALVEILEVRQQQPRDERLRGCHIDAPRAGSRVEASAVRLAGWALTPGGPALAIELASGGTVFRRVPTGLRRPDLAAAFADLPGADGAGFEAASVPVLGERAWEYEVRAVLPGQARAPLGSVRLRRADAGSAPLVSVVIPCYRQARFLGEAIDSALAQTHPRVEVVVVDDGSPDNTAAVAARYPGVIYHRQPNGGLSAARNAGWRQSRGDFIVFLDADDLLLPDAIQTGLNCLTHHPECAIAIGFHTRIAFDGTPLPVEVQRRVDKDAYLSLLRHNVCVPSAVLYRRGVLEHVNGFDEAESPAADYDIYLRIARDFPIHCHPRPVTAYRMHGTNMTRNPGLLLQSTIHVLRKQWAHASKSEPYRQACQAGMRLMRDYYGKELADEVRRDLNSRRWKQALRGMRLLLRYHPDGLSACRVPPAIGAVDFRELRTVTPISRHFGMDRGGAIDRYYIERFLAENAANVRGCVLEIGDNAYTRRFGSDRVTRSDVLHVVEGNPQATIIADLTRADHLPSDTFDCIILTQTLQFVYDVRLAVRALHRLLKPGGVLLATVPGISQLSDEQWNNSWYWGFTAVSARRLLEEAFPAENIQVATHGNVLSAISFLHGLGARDLCRHELEHHDADYPVTITLRAVKRDEGRVTTGQETSASRTATFTTRPHRAPRTLRPLGMPILLYHRVADLEMDPWNLAVTPTHFAEHMEVLRRHAHPIGLRQLAQALQEGNLPERSVVVTFDDGYADNLLNARPLLERFDIPATVFLVAGHLGSRREFWWDELERLLLRPGRLPATLHLTGAGGSRQWDLGDAANYSTDAYQRHRCWRAWEEPPTGRHALYNSLYHLLHPVEQVERRRLLDELAAWAEAGSEGRSSHRLLAPEEVTSLVQGGLIEAGAHTLTHPCLAALTPDAQREEIRGSKVRLEEVVGRPVTAFAYPYGRLCDYTPDSVAVVKEVGFSCACSNFSGVARQSADPLQLPRVMAADWDGEEFARRLSGWLEM